MLCMVPLLLLAAYLAICHVQILQSRFDQDAEHQARNLSAVIDSHLKAQIAALQMLAASPLIDDPNRWSELYSTAQSFREGFGGNVVFADLSMQMLFNTRTPFATSLPKLPVPRGHAAAPAALATGKAAVGDSFIGPIAKEQLIAVAVPVLREEQVRFLLLGVLETRFFQGLLDQVSLPAEWSLTLLDGADTVMATAKRYCWWRMNPPAGRWAS